MFARIYQPAKTAMQSGKAKTHFWLLEFEQELARKIDPLMGWTSAEDMLASEVRLRFDSKQAAIDYAKSKEIPFQVIEKPEAKPVLKAYSDNFSTFRRAPWTH